MTSLSLCVVARKLKTIFGYFCWV